MMRGSARRLGSAEPVAAGRSGRRKGFVIVEVIVAMVLLAVAVSSLAALVYSVSRSGMAATGNAYRNGVLMQEVNRFEALPYDSIPVGSVSTTVTAQPYPHSRIITVNQPVDNVVKTVKIVISPANSAFKSDSVVFTRTKARTSKLLCTDCPEE
jgi:hypothetical protein